MKKILFVLTFVAYTINSIGQSSTVIEYLDINNVRAAFLVQGDMFWEPDSGKAAYEFPKGSNIHSNFASALWIGGIERSTNTLKVAAQTYRNTGNDYWPGPLDELNGAFIDSLVSADWNQIWKVNRSTIDSFLLISTHTLGTTPKSILEWPGRNNPNCKTPSNNALTLPNRRMAPFFDVNNDNIYNALDGDYPAIRFSDQALFWVFNDNLGTKQSSSDPLKIEVHAMAYAFNCPALNNVTFLDYSIHNWSTSVFDSTYVGIWSDIDIGNAFDDFIGFDTSSQMGVVYNGDSFDEDYISQSYSSKGYDSLLTQHGIIMTQGPRVDTGIGPPLELGLSSCTYFNNSNGRDGDPSNTQEHYNYLTGSWRDGSLFKAGCDPLNGSAAPYPFVFPNPPLGPISELACGRAPGDRRIVLSSGPFELVPGIVPSRITFAFLNTDRGVDNSNFNALRIVADSARNMCC